MTTPTLLVLHGYTQNAAVARRACRAALGPLEGRMNVVYLDAPHTCHADAVRAAYAHWKTAPTPGPHHTWCHASDDGRVYEGWEAAVDSVRRALPPSGSPIGLFGFSQGAMIAGTIAALACRGSFPAIDFVVLVAGRLPRAEALKPYFGARIHLPSLHVWGERDRFACENGPRLLECFDPETRRQLLWRGSHVVPPGGEAARGITDFVVERSGLAATGQELAASISPDSSAGGSV